MNLTHALEQLKQLKAKNNQSEAEIKQLKNQFTTWLDLKAPNPVKLLQEMTLTDCMRPEGLALNLEFIWPARKLGIPSLHVPVDLTTTPSLWLCDSLKRIQSVWACNTDRGTSLVIHALITEVLHSHGLWVFCDTDNSWAGPGFDCVGNVDYLIGSTECWDTAETLNSCFLVVQTGEEWPLTGLPLVLAQAGALMKRRLDQNKQTPVFAVLTNARVFQFFAIDTQGVVYCSGNCMILSSGPDNEWASSSSLAQVLRWMAWFVYCSKVLDSKNVDEESLQRVMACLGPIQKDSINL